MWNDYNYIEILESELIPALGCTEPIAIAYAAAKAREQLGSFPERMELMCSGNIIKNVKGVTVPNSGGLRGIDVAAILGAVGGDADRELEVLESVKQEDIDRSVELLKKNFIRCSLVENVENLYVKAIAIGNGHTAEVTLQNKHTFISEIKKDGEVIYNHKDQTAEQKVDKTTLSLSGILDFANTVPIERIRPLLKKQIEMNTTISREGLKNPYGAQVGQTLLKHQGDAVHIRAKAKAAAGSDARMDGCSLPVVINSGSGNQGITVSIPVIEYARELGVDDDKLYRALALSNLTSIHIKRHIGSLSAFCGAVSAASAAGAAITYLHGGTIEQIAKTIVNTLGNVAGIVCDGAKASCAAKIASSLEAAITAHWMSMEDKVFQAHTGIIQESIENTIESIGYLGRVGMSQTDIEILHIMLGDVDFQK